MSGQKTVFVKQLKINALVAAASLMTSAALFASVEWRNLDDEHHLAGRKTSSGYLEGKVVMVDRWGVRCPPCRALLPRLEAIWQSFKGPSFVLLGGHCRGWGDKASVQKLARENGLTYPIYEDAGLAVGEPRFNAIPFLYVVDQTGRVAYRGHDERLATDTVVGLVARWESPQTVEDWRRCLKWEIDNQPAHAILRQQEFAKAFPEEAREFEAPCRALGKLPDMEGLLKLVKISRKVATYRAKDDERKKFAARIGETIERYSYLKQSKDPQVRREAKNALADLTWDKAEL